MIELKESYELPAGLPILEHVRKLEQEKIISPEEKLSIRNLLNHPNPEKRKQLLKCLRDLELGTGNMRFTIRRLRALLYNSGGGLPTPLGTVSAMGTIVVATPALVNDDGIIVPTLKEVGVEVPNAERADGSYSTRNSVLTDTPRTLISKAFGEYDPPPNSPVKDDNSLTSSLSSISSTSLVLYNHPENYNVCSKIFKRWASIQSSLRYSLKFAVLTGSGSFNPLTRMHLRQFYLAKQYLEASSLGYTVLGCLLSPDHSVTVRERYKTINSEVIPSPHRLAMAQMLVEESSFISVDPWEITRRRPMDYLSLLDHTAEMLRSQLPDVSIKVLYLCKANLVPKLSPLILRELNYGVVCVTRPPDSDTLRASIGSRWNGLITLVEDTAVLDANLDVVSSRKVRDRLRAEADVSHLVGDRIALYCVEQRIGPKMNGLEEWSTEEKALPRFAASGTHSPIIPRGGRLTDSSGIGVRSPPLTTTPAPLSGKSTATGPLPSIGSSL